MVNDLLQFLRNREPNGLTDMTFNICDSTLQDFLYALSKDFESNLMFVAKHTDTLDADEEVGINSSCEFYEVCEKMDSCVFRAEFTTDENGHIDTNDCEMWIEGLFQGLYVLEVKQDRLYVDYVIMDDSERLFRINDFTMLDFTLTEGN